MTKESDQSRDIQPRGEHTHDVIFNGALSLPDGFGSFHLITAAARAIISAKPITVTPLLVTD